MSGMEKLKLLVWKNFLLQRRHKWQTLFEILSPLLFTLLLILLRCLVDPKARPEMAYAPFQPTYINMTQINSESSKSGTVAFSPENPLTRKAAAYALQTMFDDNNKVETDLFGFMTKLAVSVSIPDPVGYNNSMDLEAALTRPKAMDSVLLGIQFDDQMANATKWPDEITVTLRFPAIMRMEAQHPMIANWRTNLLFPLFPQSGPRESGNKFGGNTPGYSSEMFLAIQHGISKSIIVQKSGKPFDAKVYMQRLPQLAFRDDPLLMALERLVTIIIMLGFSYTFVNTVRVITVEKELQLKETMAIMGMPSWLHWLAWFIKQFSFLVVSAVLMVIMLKIPIHQTVDGEWFAVFTFTPWSILFFFMLLFVIASLAFAFMVSVFFSRANSAASFMGLIWFASYAVFMFTQMLYGQIKLSTKFLLSFISNTAVGFAFQMLIWCEGNGRGLQWNEFFTPISYDDQFYPGHVVMMLVLDTFLYAIIAAYVEKIRPGLYGVPLPWYFPFTKSFWTGETGITDINGKDDADLEYNDALLKVVHDEEPKGVPAGVNIKNLSKVYDGRKKKAVDNLNLRIYENEITILLGHNGAGKTTTISMLTGMVNPSSGSAHINGYNIATETELARKSLGICPQHNVLFPDLTVTEHIIFYARLKGLSPDKINEEIEHFVKLLDLEDKRDVVSDNLSGGQKRRLSVAAAMCGASRVVLLDEPTSGLDPAARRALWDLLQHEKRGRTIILTTHFMDEADVLGDRIAIMSGGKLQCYGTPFFLKKHYGLGYKLTILKVEGCNVDEIMKFFKKYVPSVKENTNIGSELTYILPTDNTSKFPEMLKELENQKESLKIESYGLSITSIEEVFMKAGAEYNVDELPVNGHKMNGFNHSDMELMENGNDTYNNYDLMDNEPIKKVRGVKLLINRIQAMFMKLAYSTWRSKVTSSIQLTWPVINIIISIVLSRSWEFLAELPPLSLNLEQGFRRTQTILAQEMNLTDGTFEARSMNAYKDYFKTSTYPGMTLTDIGAMDMGKFYMKLSSTDIPRIRYETLVGATFSRNNITAWFSNYGYHDSAISLALVNNAVLRSVSPGSSLKFINHPLPYSLENWISVMATGSSMAFQFSFNLGFCLGLVSSFIVLFVIKERVSGAKLLQRVAGMRPGVMWGCAFVWDWLWLLLVHVLIIATLACFQETTLSTNEELARAMLVLMVFSFGIIPLHYLASYFFDDAATGFTKMCFVNTFAGCMPFLITEVMRMPEIGSKYYADIFDGIFCLLPTYNVCKSLRDMSVTTFSIIACEGLCETLQLKNCTRHTLCEKPDFSMCCIDENPYLGWKEPGIARYLVMTALVGSVAFTVLLLKEYEVFDKFYRKRQYRLPPVADDEDSDVAAERVRVNNMTGLDRQHASLVCHDLTKYYGDFLAVNRLSFGVERGECFGLLGMNGAGKTSTFRMLTGDASISAGSAYVLGQALGSRGHARRDIGYCPQFDALLDALTARETLRMFALVRGLAGGDERALAARLGFSRHLQVAVAACSGGTRRKISAAVALLGAPALTLLDEPTTGMDPASKRRVWAALGAARRGGRSALLTSHSMEECEALCSRLAVMARARTACLGHLQHLKHKFSHGYTLIVKCEQGPDRETYLAKVGEYIKENFNEAKLVETYLGMSTYYIKDPSVQWWRLFDVMERARQLFPVEDYSVTQTTLEQVFLRLSGQSERT